MRKLTVPLGFALTLALLSHSVALACGDKLLSLGRGVLMQRAYRASRPAAILIYTGQNSKGGSLAAPALQESLTHAGHRLQVAANATQAQDLLKSGGFDLVLADFADADMLAAEAKSTPSKPTVLPVMYKPAKSEFAAAEKKYGMVLKASGVTGEFLMAIEQAMKIRSRSAHS